tara:strand:- start:33 stop:170 length:138 start_codon:yes stop_codon:yes gene_type:complete
MYGDEWWVCNEIDDSEQTLTKSQLFDTDFTNIGKAIENGNFFYLN